MMGLRGSVMDEYTHGRPVTVSLYGPVTDEYMHTRAAMAYL